MKGFDKKVLLSLQKEAEDDKDVEEDKEGTFFGKFQDIPKMLSIGTCGGPLSSEGSRNVPPPKCPHIVALVVKVGQAVREGLVGEDGQPMGLDQGMIVKRN